MIFLAKFESINFASNMSFVALPYELQSEIIRFSGLKGWLSMRVVNKKMQQLCAWKKLRQHIFAPYTLPLTLPPPYQDTVSVETQGVPYLQPPPDMDLPRLLIVGYAYNPIGEPLSQEEWFKWLERKGNDFFETFEKIHFAMCVTGYTDGRGGYWERLKLPDGTAMQIRVLKNRSYPDWDEDEVGYIPTHGKWEWWDFECFASDDPPMFLPCNIWVRRLDDPCSWSTVTPGPPQEQRSELVSTPILPSLPPLRPIQHRQDLEKLWNDVLLL